MDYLDNNRLIAHHCGFNIMEPLPSYWTYDRFLKKMDNVELKEIMATQVKKNVIDRLCDVIRNLPAIVIQSITGRQWILSMF